MAGSEKNNVTRRKEDHGWKGEREHFDEILESWWDTRDWKEDSTKGLKREFPNWWGNGTIGRRRNSDARPKDRSHDYAEAGRAPPTSRNKHREAPQKAFVVSQGT